MPAQPSDENLVLLFRRVDNAGRWGPDDELGTLNYITPDRRRAATLLVREGLTLSLALSMSSQSKPGRGHVEHRMLGAIGAADDMVSFTVHQEDFTHLDCVSHIASHDGFAYNRRPYDGAVTMDGVQRGSVLAQGGGIFTRGVLLDLPAALGVAALEPEQEFTAGDLERAEAHAGVSVGSGDVLVVRTGVQAGEYPSVLRPGPGPSCVEWLHRREVAVFTGDSAERITPAGARALGLLPDRGDGDEHAPSTRFPLPFHQIAIPAMGLSLLDFCAVEALAETCARLGRYEFLFAAAPLPIERGTGSPINPLAVY